ncbi:MAG: pantoate--beta-alanine ligase [Peptococcaceae bacterium]|nr:pantoate--beta-alanine ligase [Peptococcaceae bacterium]MDH7523696.1 pantoate--beta-alanine ligase [Peptococcaceae bacterium]
MEIITTVAEMRRWGKEKVLKRREIGLVPTMGYLHEGHLTLVESAKKENHEVVMSIFVNPLQFGPQEDYSTYPRDLDRDSRLAEKAGVDVIFAPSVEEMYPSYPQLTTVQVSELTEGLCGASRPGHFTGVATVVCKLLNIVRPERAYFGQKDYQQVQVVKRMVEDLNIPVEIRTVPIKREADGLAMSSRNTYLSAQERKDALCLYESLKACRDLYEKGERESARLKEAMRKVIMSRPAAVIDYIEICDAVTLKPVTQVKGPAVAALAVKIGRTRLIDNMIFGG